MRLEKDEAKAEAEAEAKIVKLIARVRFYFLFAGNCILLLINVTWSNKFDLYRLKSVTAEMSSKGKSRSGSDLDLLLKDLRTRLHLLHGRVFAHDPARLSPLSACIRLASSQPKNHFSIHASTG